MTDPGVAIVIPAHNEEELLERCLKSVDSATRRVETDVRVVVVLDACRDGSEEVAARWPVSVVLIDAHNVGVARRAGVDRALRLLR